MMPTFVDARPAGVDVAFRPGTTLNVTLNWPAGSLAGRSFTSTLDGTTLAVAVDVDVMTVTASQAQTAAVTEPAVWLLLEDTGDGPEPIIIGEWRPSGQPSTPSSTVVQVTQGTVVVTVQVGADDARFHRPYLTVPSGWGERWAAALAEADTRLVRVGVISDSIGSGPFADDHDFVWPALIRQALQASHGDGGSGWLDWFNSSVGGFGGPGGPDGNDTTQTGAWTDIQNGVNNTARRPTVDGNGATMTFHPRGTTIDIVSRTDPTFGRYDRQIDGGAVVQQPQNVAAGVSTVTISGLAPGYHTVVITAAAGQCRIHGVRGRNATGVLVDNFSSGGRGLALGTNILTSAAEGLTGQTSMSTSFGVLAPLDLLLVSLGVNDDSSGTAFSADTYWDALGGLQRSIRFAGINPETPPEVVTVVEHVSGHTDSEALIGYDYPRIASIWHEWSRGVGAAVADVWAKGRYSAAYANSLGWWVLTPLDVHPSHVGHEAYAEGPLALVAGQPSGGA